MDFMCTNTASVMNGPGDANINNRFRRQVGVDKLKDTEMHYRGKRFAISTTVRTPENCVELGGFSPPPRSTVS